jgi:hypothetical protein
MEKRKGNLESANHCFVWFSQVAKGKQQTKREKDLREKQEETTEHIRKNRPARKEKKGKKKCQLKRNKEKNDWTNITIWPNPKAIAPVLPLNLFS